MSYSAMTPAPEHVAPYGDFSVCPTALGILGEVKASFGRLVTVYWLDDTGIMQQVTGTARHVTVDERGAFASVWTPRSLLRVTATFEHFIALGRIYAIEVAR